MTLQRLGFFTRVLDDADPAERYRLAAAQVVHAERCGFDGAWVAQHHFHGDEGGLPAPFVFLSHVAAQTSRIRLGTGIVTLPLEQPVRTAEDAAVLDLMCGGRLEMGVGAGGNTTAFQAFGVDVTERAAKFRAHLDLLRTALLGWALPGGDRLYPSSPRLVNRIWQASFSIEGAAIAGAAGDGLLLSRTQPRPADAPGATLADLQAPMIEAYLAALPPGRAPRILASRSVFVADGREEALRFAEAGLGRGRARLPPGAPRGLDDLIAANDVHVGAPMDVIASLRADRTLGHVTDLAVQVHSVDPPHALILRSIELMAEIVAPALGWVRGGTAGMRRVA